MAYGSSTAFLLNFVLILGPLLGAAPFVWVGMLSLGTHWAAMLRALYFATTPPRATRRRNPWRGGSPSTPAALVLALVFLYWMWGIPGAVLALRMLAITKIICDDIPSLRGVFGAFPRRLTRLPEGAHAPGIGHARSCVAAGFGTY